MSHLINWDDEDHTIYHLNFLGVWTWEEWSIAFRDGYAEMGKASHCVDVIIQIQNAVPYGNAVPHIKYAGANQPPNARHTVIVNQSGIFLETLVKLIVHNNGWVGPAFVNTVPEAREYLQEKRGLDDCYTNE